LFKDSDICGASSPNMPGKTIQIKENWIQDGILVPNGENFKLTKDCLLSSSSYAAVMVAGTTRSGPQSWIDSQGRTLKAIEELLLSESFK